MNPWTQDYEIWPQETRNVAALYGVERSTDYYFVLSQYKRLTDGRMDGRTDGRTDGQMSIATCKCALKTEDVNSNNVHRCLPVNGHWWQDPPCPPQRQYLCWAVVIIRHIRQKITVLCCIVFISCTISHLYTFIPAVLISEIWPVGLRLFLCVCVFFARCSQLLSVC